MVTIGTGLAINTATAGDRTTATLFRNAFGALLFKVGSSVLPQAGRLAGSFGSSAALAVQSASTSALTFSVTAGYAVVTRSAAPALGAYLVGTPAAVSVTLTAANASNPRIDTVYICQPDPEAGDSTQARIDVLAGTAAASPAAPADSLLPQGSLRLANVLVPAGATAASACTITTVGAAEAALTSTLPTFANVAALPASAPYRQEAIVQNPTTAANGVIAAGPGTANVIYRMTSTGWRPWDSDWTSFTSTWSNVSTPANAGGQFRWTSGKVRHEQAVQLPSASNGNGVTSTLPVAARQTPLYSGVNSQSGWWVTGRGNLFNGNDVDLVVGFNDANTVRFGVPNASKLIDTVGAGFTFGAGNALRYLVEYDPA